MCLETARSVGSTACRSGRVSVARVAKRVRLVGLDFRIASPGHRSAVRDPWCASREAARGRHTEDVPATGSYGRRASTISVDLTERKTRRHHKRSVIGNIEVRRVHCNDIQWPDYSRYRARSMFSCHPGFASSNAARTAGSRSVGMVASTISFEFGYSRWKLLGS